MTVKVIYIEGNIGSGKSTLLDTLDDKPWIIRNGLNTDFVVVQEPVNDWRKSGSLASLYNHTVSNTLFQMMVLCTRSSKLHTEISTIISKYKNSKKNIIIFAERGLEFGDKAFSQVSIEDENEMNLYKSSSSAIVKSIHHSLQEIDVAYKEYYVYLRLSPEMCMERINARNRCEETSITIEYLHELHETHEKISKELDQNKLFTIDANFDKKYIVQNLRDIISLILKP